MYTLHHGDCMDVIPTLANVDAVITDPPYGTTACKWDSVIPLDAMWVKLKRIVKPRGAIVLFGAQPFTSALIMSNVAWFKYSWVWEKQQPTGFLDVQRKPMRSHEDITVFASGQTTYNPQDTKATSVKNGRLNKAGNGCYGSVKSSDYVQKTGNYPRTVIRFDRVSNGQLHPTQKPVDLLRYLVKTYTNAGDTVLDFTMGSGTTGVACAIEGRNFIGIELDAEYFRIAEKRIADAAAQPQLIGGQ